MIGLLGSRSCSRARRQKRNMKVLKTTYGGHLHGRHQTHHQGPWLYQSIDSMKFSIKKFEDVQVVLEEMPGSIISRAPMSARPNLVQQAWRASARRVHIKHQRKKHVIEQILIDGNRRMSWPWNFSACNIANTSAAATRSIVAGARMSHNHIDYHDIGAAAKPKTQTACNEKSNMMPSS